MFHRLSAVAVLTLLACSSSTPTSIADSGTAPDAASNVSDAGAPPVVDAGPPEIKLPVQPTLDELTAWWNAKAACRLYACEQRVRQTPETCALALQANGIPYDTFRLAQASVKAGRATYDPEAGKRCAALLRAVDLESDCFGESVTPLRQGYGAEFVQNCADLITGKVGQDGACDYDLECVPGAGCAWGRDYPACSGKCIVWLKAGETCTNRYNDCVHGTYCDGTKCKSRQLLPDGQTCYDSGESCQSGKCFNYQCRTVSPKDGECIGQDDCYPGLFCRPLPASTGWQGVCQLPVGTGQECGYLSRCTGNQSCDGYFWKYQGGWTAGQCGDHPENVGGTCVPIKDGYDYGDTGCFNDLVCNPATSKCVEPPAIGAPCSIPAKTCGFNAYCDLPPAVDGGSDGGSDLDGGMDAGVPVVLGTCRTKKAPGEDAPSAAACQDQYDTYEKKCYRQSDRDRCSHF